MAGKTNTEKIDELSRLVYSLLERVKAIEDDIADLPALSTRVAVIEQQLVDLKKHHDNLITRLWMIGVPLIVTLFGGILTALLRK